MIEFVDVAKRFSVNTPDELMLFEKFNFKINDGEFISVIGSNGSGKTTLLNLLCGAIRPDSGKILFNGCDTGLLPEYKCYEKTGRVFQNPEMGSASHLTVLENMALSHNKNKRFSLGRAISRKNIDYYKTLLEKCSMGLENRLDAVVGTLSGGQRQALALVLATMNNPELLILDEHTAALDPKSADVIMKLTDSIVSEKTITTLMVTHNLNFAIEYGSRLVVMNKGEIVSDIDEGEKKSIDAQRLFSLFSTF